jgi:DNA-binding LytR/AlgR family response regulator
MSSEPTITALIAEDEPLLAQGLKSDLQSIWPELQLLPLASNGHEALAAALTHAPQVCFFDIRMPGLDGLEAAQAIAEEWTEDGPAFPLLVFVTAFDQFAVRAFEQQAVDYLLKPVDMPRLKACVQRLQKRLAQRQPRPVGAASVPQADMQHAMQQLHALLQALPHGAPSGQSASSAPRLEVIQAQTGQIVSFVQVKDVLFFEAADKYVRVVTAAKEFLIRTPLKELLPQLDPQRFWQVHRGTVVQAACIAQARREESGKVLLSVIGSKETVTVSRLYAHLFKGM